MEPMSMKEKLILGCMAVLLLVLVLGSVGCAMAPKASFEEGRYAETRRAGATDNTDALADIAVFHLNQNIQTKRDGVNTKSADAMALVRTIRNPALAADEGWIAAIKHNNAMRAIDDVAAAEMAVIDSRRAAGAEYAGDAIVVFEMQEKVRAASRKFWAGTINQGVELGGRIYAQHQAQQAAEAAEKEAEAARKALAKREAELAQREAALEEHRPPEPAPEPAPAPATPAPATPPVVPVIP